MQNPKAHKVAMAALKFPSNPSQGFDLTQSVIIQVTVSITVFIKQRLSQENSNLPTENIAITIKVDAKYGITDRVFFSSSWSRVFEANRAILMCLKRFSTSWICSIRFRKASSHAPPL